jgi:ankyrin repeat protein
MRLFRPDENQPNDDPRLVEAVEAGDVESVRELLAAGAFVDSRDLAGHSVLVIAGVNGHREIFEMLLDAGADPYFPFMGIDSGAMALTQAASMGRSEIVEAWLQRGLDVNVADGVGNTPLMAAAAAGQLDAVRRLLAAGSDMNARTVDGISAYSVALHGRHHDVVAVLREAGATFDPNDPLMAEQFSFEAQPDESLFRDVLAQVAQVVGRPVRWDQHGEVLKFADVVLNLAQWQQLHEQVQRRGFHLVQARPNPLAGPTTLLLFPTKDKYAVIKACGTDGGTCDLSTQRIIAWLRKLDKKLPFVLTGCGHDFLAGRFLSPIRDGSQLAMKMFAFCPDIVDQGCGSVDALAREIERTQRFCLWWD